MRGTEDLLPEQRPRRKRKMRGRSQLYRYQTRPYGPTLEAMLRGRPQFLPNPMDARRRFQKKRGR